MFKFPHAVPHREQENTPIIAPSADQIKPINVAKVKKSYGSVDHAAALFFRAEKSPVSPAKPHGYGDQRVKRLWFVSFSDRRRLPQVK